MAGTDRAQVDDLIDWTALAAKLPEAGLFAVVRHIEARRAELPRLGAARLPSQNVVDLAQQPAMGFVGGTLASIEPHHGRHQLRGFWLGLTGPMGPLPSHMTEYACHERRHAAQTPYSDWLDVLAGRMLQLFYRAWADSQPAAQADRPDGDKFAGWVGMLTGASAGARDDQDFFTRARAHYAPVFAGSRSAVAIEDALSHLLRQPVRVFEYIPKWRSFEAEDRTCLSRKFVTLGRDAVLGRRVFSAADAFRVVVRARNFADYRSMLPGGTRFAVAAEAIEAFKPTHLEWDLCVEVDDRDAPAVRLDGSVRLGWSSWVKRPAHGVGQFIRADAHLRKSSLGKRKPAV
ncbi:type VI secretion system baseplate subunit TssG [Novosphingobium sp.]|uniref:type VI secretion system baseplate subunit TssG n=1 Tax=Novosphingobium sp. TaxID=1874826 RepID=UPI003B526258